MWTTLWPSLSKGQFLITVPLFQSSRKQWWETSHILWRWRQTEQQSEATTWGMRLRASSSVLRGYSKGDVCREDGSGDRKLNGMHVTAPSPTGCWKIHLCLKVHSFLVLSDVEKDKSLKRRLDGVLRPLYHQQLNSPQAGFCEVQVDNQLWKRLQDFHRAKDFLSSFAFFMLFLHSFLPSVSHTLKENIWHGNQDNHKDCMIISNFILTDSHRHIAAVLLWLNVSPETSWMLKKKSKWVTLHFDSTLTVSVFVQRSDPF